MSSFLCFLPPPPFFFLLLHSQYEFLTDFYLHLIFIMELCNTLTSLLKLLLIRKNFTEINRNSGPQTALLNKELAIHASYDEVFSWDWQDDMGEGGGATNSSKHHIILTMQKWLIQIVIRAELFMSLFNKMRKNVNSYIVKLWHNNHNDRFQTVFP